MLNIAWTITNVFKTWESMHESNKAVIRVCMQVKELVDVKHKYVDGVLNKGDIVK